MINQVFLCSFAPPQAINQAERDAALAALAASENSLKSRVAEGGKEEGAAKDGVTSLRKTSSESSSGHKGPSESEIEDSVFSSDKEGEELELWLYTSFEAEQTPEKP